MGVCNVFFGMLNAFTLNSITLRRIKRLIERMFVLYMQLHDRCIFEKKIASRPFADYFVAMVLGKKVD